MVPGNGIRSDGPLKTVGIVTALRWSLTKVADDRCDGNFCSFFGYLSPNEHLQ